MSEWDRNRKSPTDLARRDDLFMLAPEPYLITDSFGTITESNLAAQVFFGANEGTLQRKPLQVFMAEEWRRQAFRSELARLIPSDTFSLEIQLKPYHREKCYVALSGVKTVDNDHGERILWLIRDLTERYRAEAEIKKGREELQQRVDERTSELQHTLHRLERALKAKDEFLGLMSHELRTPLTVILGNARVLRAHAVEMAPEDLQLALGDMADESERLQRLIENLMTLARLDSETRPDVEPVLLQRLVPALVERFEHHFKGVVIRQLIPDDTEMVSGIPVYLEQVLNNLLSNALKYAVGSHIDIAAESRADHVVVCVRDYGPGMLPDDAAHAFEPFFRGNGGAAQPGAGIGLTVCQRLLEAQGGEIWIDSIQGQGTAFKFTLPFWEGNRAGHIA